MIKTFKNFAVLILAILFCNFTLKAQTSAKDMSQRMTRGINLGNTFDAENYEGGWAPAATEKDFEAFKEAGFTCVRIPVTWHAGLSKTDSTLRFDIAKPYKVQDAFFTRLDEVVNWSLERGLVTIINVHHDHWLKKASTFDNNKERFYTLWKQIAKHYKDYPETLLFEILNEPHHETDGKDDGLTQDQVDELNKEALAIIRKTNPTRIAIYGGRSWGGLSELNKTIVPDANDKYLIGTYHSYSPWPFAGDGNGSWGTEKDIETMESEFKNMKAYSEKYNVPVYIGEFGAQHQCEYNDRMLHFACYVENIQKYNVPSTTWDDCGFRFKIYDRETGQWDDAKDILVNYTTDSPNGLKLGLEDGNFVKLDWVNRAEDIENITIERRVSRKGIFKALKDIETATSYIDETSNERQTYYYYRVVNHLKGGEKLISYPQSVYIP